MNFMSKRVAGALLSCLAIASASADPLPTSVRQALSKAGIPMSAVGISVRAVDGSKSLFEWNETQAMNPASTMKLVTTAAALDLLGPTFTWKTQVYANGTITGDVLKGDLHVRGGGDPKLVPENLWLLVREIRARGIREIRGNLVLDRSLFKLEEQTPDQFDNDPQRAYNASPDALMLNYQALRLHLHPLGGAGQVAVMVDPALAGVTVQPPRLVNQDCGDWKSKLGFSIEGETLHFSGSYAAACGDQVLNVNPYQLGANQFFGAAFTAAWREAGGIMSGKVLEAGVPTTAQLLLEWQSPTLPDVIRDINKYSNNVMARQLLYTLGAYGDDATQTGTRARGLQRIRDWLESKKIRTDGLVMENGSGLSRLERISPDQLVRVLTVAHRSPYMPEFVASLPIIGNDGTMRTRLREQAVAGQGHIKTGTLRDAKAIAGYVLASSGRTYIVVCEINHANAGRGQEAQDALLAWVYDNG